MVPFRVKIDDKVGFTLICGYYEMVSSGSHSDPVRISSTAPPSHPNTAYSDTEMATAAMPNSRLQNGRPKKPMDGVTGVLYLTFPCEYTT